MKVMNDFKAKLCKLVTCHAAAPVTEYYVFLHRNFFADSMTSSSSNLWGVLANCDWMHQVATNGVF
jgi:hypothetical protein